MAKTAKKKTPRKRYIPPSRHPPHEPGQPGRPRHKPTDEYRAQVTTMAAAGIPQELIARVIGISTPTLVRHYRDEIDLSMVKANSAVARSLFQKATGNGPTSVTAAIFWLKCQAGWKDRTGIEVTGANGGPIDTRNLVLNAEEYRQLAREVLQEF